MTNEEFILKMKEILDKAGKASNTDFFEMYDVSDDPDYVADFGYDINGNLVLLEETFPLKIANLTNIRYRWYGEDDAGEGYFRFDFGQNIRIKYGFNAEGYETFFSVEYYDNKKYGLKIREAVSYLNELVG